MSGEAIALVLVGLVIGAVASWFAGRAVEGLLFEASARGVVPYLAASGLLVLVAIVASALPVWRATRVNPVTALRAE